VAYAIGRRVGNAVTRNRVRRRLRSAVAGQAPKLRPGSAYLVSAQRAAATIPYGELEQMVCECLESA
jgi:ribonuclease P protein component